MRVPRTIDLRRPSAWPSSHAEIAEGCKSEFQVLTKALSRTGQFLWHMHPTCGLRCRHLQTRLELGASRQRFVDLKPKLLITEAKQLLQDQHLESDQRFQSLLPCTCDDASCQQRKSDCPSGRSPVLDQFSTNGIGTG